MRRAGRIVSLAVPESGAAALFRLLEPLELFVTAFDRSVERLLGRLLTRPHLLHLLVDDGADLHEVAEADSTRLVGGLADHLRDGHIGAGILLVEPRLLGQLKGRQSDRQVSSALVARSLHLGFRQVVEKSGPALLLSPLLSRHYPQA